MFVFKQITIFACMGELSAHHLDIHECKMLVFNVSRGNITYVMPIYLHADRQSFENTVNLVSPY